MTPKQKSTLMTALYTWAEGFIFFLATIVASTITHGRWAPFFILIFFYDHVFKNTLSWYYLIILGLLFDNLEGLDMGFYPVIFLMLNYGMTYGTKHIFEESHLRHEGGFSILCIAFMGFEAVGYLLVGHTLTPLTHYIIDFCSLLLLYFIYKRIILPNP
ncbi:MAG: hypothetical protein Q8K36_00600 [Alphaproteobacteria bacterium]|nr:hypothetical protein [Alphaproteobacteria bacterium]